MPLMPPVLDVNLSALPRTSLLLRGKFIIDWRALGCVRCYHCHLVEAVSSRLAYTPSLVHLCHRATCYPP